jgi:hypothetical protein
MATITIYDKLACVQRELRMRREVYPRRVVNKKMSQAQADREIAVMEAIVDDYDRSSKVMEPELFDGNAVA